MCDIIQIVKKETDLWRHHCPFVSDKSVTSPIKLVKIENMCDVIKIVKKETDLWRHRCPFVTDNSNIASAFLQCRFELVGPGNKSSHVENNFTQKQLTTLLNRLILTLGWVQWRSEIWTCPVLEWLKRGQFANGPVIESDLLSWSKRI